MESLFATHIAPWLIKITLAGVIAAVGYLIAKYTTPVLKGALKRTGLDAMLVGFITAIVRAIFLLFVAIAALSQLGLDTTSLVALVGAAGIAVGLALKDSLGNFAAGVMILLFRPFKSGDFIISGNIMGVVNEISIFHTRMHNPENVEMIVPNSVLYSNPITNFSVRDTRRLELAVGIDYSDDIETAKQIIRQVFDNEPRVLQDPAPVILVQEFGASSVDLLVRPWVNSADMPIIKSDLQQKIKEAFDSNGITIPFPQLVVSQNDPFSGTPAQKTG